MKTGRRTFLDAVEVAVVILLVMFGIFYLNGFFNGGLVKFGILPRTTWGLMGILFSPLLHGSAAHLMANASSLFPLLVILFWHREYRPDRALIAIWIGSGIGTWIIGRSDFHIGASGIVYGLVVYIVATAWWRRNWVLVFWAIVILFLYGGIVYGMLPQQGLISWEGHLSGAIAGFIVARRQHG